MRVLIVKTSSLGDVLHCMPAVTDAIRARPQLKIEWIVESPFASLVELHPGVPIIHPVSLREWRNDWWHSYRSGKLHEWKKNLSASYDLIIDAQGLIKSAWLARQAHGPIAGFTHPREWMARWFYTHRYPVGAALHAVAKQRYLLSQALKYSLASNEPLRYELRIPETWPSLSYSVPSQALLFLHGTTWRSKQWPEDQWIALVRHATHEGWNVLLPFAHPEEQQRAERIVGQAQGGTVLPALSLKEMIQLIHQVTGVVSVDTGLGHLAAALEKPVVGIYGATTPDKTGILGPHVLNIKAEKDCAPCLKRECVLNAEIPPCYVSVSPAHVYEQLMNLIRAS